MTVEYTSLAKVIERAKQTSIDRYVLLFKDMPDTVSELTFGPLDWLEADAWSSVEDKLVMLDPQDGALIPTPPDAASMASELHEILTSAPANRDLIGYNLAQQMPTSIRAKSMLWRADYDADDEPQARSSARFTNSSGEQWQAFYQTLPMFWCRRTYRIDFGVFDWLTKLCTDREFEQTQVPGDFADHFLGSIDAYAKKWRPFGGAVLAIPRDYADRGWKRKFDALAGVPVDVGGRPNKANKAADAYFYLFPNNHDHPSAATSGPVYWQHALNAVIERTGEKLMLSTFRGKITKDPRYLANKM